MDEVTRQRVRDLDEELAYAITKASLPSCECQLPASVVMNGVYYCGACALGLMVPWEVAV